MSIKEILFDFFDRNTDRSLEYLLEKLPRQALKLKLSELKEFYKIWRVEYLNSYGERYSKLDEFCELKMMTATKFTHKEDIEEALMMKKRKCSVKDIFRITGLSPGQQCRYFKEAFLRGLLSTKDYKVRS